jgi:hypothetical protein
MDFLNLNLDSLNVVEIFFLVFGLFFIMCSPSLLYLSCSKIIEEDMHYEEAV